MAFVWASLGVAFFHTILPVHWLPYIATAKANRWTWVHLIRVTLTGILVHIASTVLVTGLALLLSRGLDELGDHAGGLVGGALLILLAIGYLLLPDRLDKWNRQVSWLVAVGVGIQPCVELIPVMLIAATAGTAAVLVTAATWFTTVTIVSLALVSAGFWGLPWHFSDRTMRFVKWGVGLLLLISGVLSLWHH